MMTAALRHQDLILSEPQEPPRLLDWQPSDAPPSGIVGSFCSAENEPPASLEQGAGSFPALARTAARVDAGPLSDAVVHLMHELQRQCVQTVVSALVLIWPVQYVTGMSWELLVGYVFGTVGASLSVLAATWWSISRQMVVERDGRHLSLSRRRGILKSRRRPDLASGSF